MRRGVDGARVDLSKPLGPFPFALLRGCAFPCASPPIALRWVPLIVRRHQGPEVNSGLILFHLETFASFPSICAVSPKHPRAIPQRSLPRSSLPGLPSPVMSAAHLISRYRNQ
jgi:hypothetical protein